MAEPIEYQIILDLQTALQAISTAGGYFHDVVGVGVKLDPDAKVEDLIGAAGARPFIILEVNQETWDYFQAEQVRLIMPFVIHFVNDIDPKADPAMLKSFFRMSADAEKAIAADITRGGLAVDTTITGREKRDYQGQLTWTRIECEVKEHREYGKPNG